MVAPDATCLHDRPYLDGRHGDRLPPRQLLPQPPHPAATSSRGRGRPRPLLTSARCRCCSGAAPEARWILAAMLAAGPATATVSLGDRRRLRRRPSSARCRSFVEAQRGRCPRTFGRNHAARLARSPAGARSTGRSSRSQPAAPDDDRPAHRRARSPSGSPTAPACRPASASIPNAVLAVAGRPPRPRHPHRAAVRRRDRPRRAGRGHRRAQGPAAARKVGGHVRARHAAGSTTSSTRTGRRAAAGRLGERPARSSPRSAQLRVDQRHHRGRPARPGARRRRSAASYWSGSRRPGRLRPRRHVLTGRPGLHRPAARRPSAARCRRIVGRLGRGSVVTTLEEHHRQGASPSTAWPSCSSRTIRRAGCHDD